MKTVMTFLLDGELQKTQDELQKYLAKGLDLGEHYGHNLDALWDVLRSEVPGPLHIVWLNSAQARQHIGAEYFDKVVDIFKRVQAARSKHEPDQQFTYELR